MAFCYNRLWKLLSDREDDAHANASRRRYIYIYPCETFQGEDVNVSICVKICNALG